ncbi:hypothetical protein G9U51_15190 [Calidifontibacter sp. DB0510]|uniref:Bacteriocin-protection protein n=1 Tax=Metallococcus carri TaxID=1656884 RepID=A0A967B356_9MICO|nr:YdeI/OmpD-associated family protein [Metallococcus carri]NHN57114.1 hypothetical protein [Metallococcus carri]NOP39017.1 hypothetical protein [Calidifontibacter sp. DB2511S]
MNRPEREPGRPGGSAERPARFFTDAAQWRSWLELHHADRTELWMGLHKKHVVDRGLTWADAVPVALCFGWIDSQVQTIDDDSVRQRWTPRKPGSTWSAVNVAHVERLIAEGAMTPAGLAAFEQRRPDRTGVYSFEQPVRELPEPYAARLLADPVASAFWSAATPGYRRICTHWVLSAKQEATREKRLEQLIDDSRHGRLIPSQRYGKQPAWVATARAALDLTGD